MYEKSFKLEIITPRKIVFQADATSLIAPGALGGFQVLHDHAPLLSALNIGDIRVKDPSGKDTVYATTGGFVEVKDNNVVVLAETAEPVDEIDVDRAKAAKERAEKRLQSKDKDVDLDRARAALARALNRLRLVSAHN